MDRGRGVLLAEEAILTDRRRLVCLIQDPVSTSLMLESRVFGVLHSLEDGLMAGV